MWKPTNQPATPGRPAEPEQRPTVSAPPSPSMSVPAAAPQRSSGCQHQRSRDRCARQSPGQSHGERPGRHPQRWFADGRCSCRAYLDRRWRVLQGRHRHPQGGTAGWTEGQRRRSQTRRSRSRTGSGRTSIESLIRFGEESPQDGHPQRCPF
jgi:hypothetical protein